MKHRLASLAAVALFAVFVGCSPTPPERCEPAATRCRGTTVDICASDGFWQVSEDCGSIRSGGQWVCVAPEADLPACVPEGQTPSDTGGAEDARADTGADADGGGS